MVCTNYPVLFITVLKCFRLSPVEIRVKEYKSTNSGKIIWQIPKVCETVCMITKHNVKETSENIQENLLAFLDGMSNDVLARVCQIVVDETNKLKEKADKWNDLHFSLLSVGRLLFPVRIRFNFNIVWGMERIQRRFVMTWLISSNILFPVMIWAFARVKLSFVFQDGK